MTNFINATVGGPSSSGNVVLGGVQGYGGYQQSENPNYGFGSFGHESGGGLFNPALTMALWNQGNPGSSNSPRVDSSEMRQEADDEEVDVVDLDEAEEPLDVSDGTVANGSLDELLKSDVFKKHLEPVAAARMIARFGMTRSMFLTISFEYFISQDVCQILRCRSEVLRSRKHGAGGAAQHRFGQECER